MSILQHAHTGRSTEYLTWHLKDELVLPAAAPAVIADFVLDCIPFPEWVRALRQEGLAQQS